MTVILDLAPTLEARLKAEAHQRDMSVSDFVKMLLTRLEELDDQANASAREDPEVLLTEALRQMKERQIKNRELAVEVMAQKNNLESEVAKEERIVAEYERKATTALQDGNRELAKKYFQERTLQEHLLQQMHGNLASAIEATEQVKKAIQHEEERIRLRYTEGLVKQMRRKQARLLDNVGSLVEQFAGSPSFGVENENWDQRFEDWVATKIAMEIKTQETPHDLDSTDLPTDAVS